MERSAFLISALDACFKAMDDVAVRANPFGVGEKKSCSISAGQLIAILTRPSFGAVFCCERMREGLFMSSNAGKRACGGLPRGEAGRGMEDSAEVSLMGAVTFQPMSG